MAQIIIGRYGTQPFPINDDAVSGQHAIFTFDEATRQMYIMDNGSTNGTFIRRGGRGSFVPVVGTEFIDATTQIRLGPRLVVLPGQLLSAPAQQHPAQGGRMAAQQPAAPKRVDIAYLRLVGERYEMEKLQLQTMQTSLNNYRSLSLIGSMASGLVGTAVTVMLGEEYKGISIAVSAVILIGLLCLWVYCNSASKELPLKMANNDKNYKIKYCCPNCHLPLAGRLYENLLAEGKCPKCKCEFYDSSH